jgi:hypothetical protein
MVTTAPGSRRRKPTTVCLSLGTLGAPSVDVDREAGVIRGVSLMTEGPARGWGFWCDEVLMVQLAEQINAAPNGIKVRTSHPEITGSDGAFYLVGRARDAVVDGNQLRVDIHLGAYAKSSPQGDLWTYLLDIATSDPSVLGLSVMFQQAPTQEREIDGSRVPCGRSAAVYAVDFTDNPAANEHGMLTAADLDFTAGDAGAPSGDITMLTNLASALETLLGERATNEQARSDLILAMGSAVGDDSFTFDTLHAVGAACPTMETLSSWAEVLGADVATLRAAAEADGCTYAASEESSTPADGAGDTSDTPAEPDATPLSVPKPKRTSQAPNPAAILARERTRVASLTTIADQAGFDRAWINKHVAPEKPGPFCCPENGGIPPRSAGIPHR